MTPRKETPIATRQAVINMRENGMRGTEIAMRTSTIMTLCVQISDTQQDVKLSTKPVSRLNERRVSKFTFWNKTRFVILIIGLVCLLTAYANMLLMNFTVICMQDVIVEQSVNETYGNHWLQKSYDVSLTFSAAAVGAIIGTIPAMSLIQKFGLSIIFTIYGLSSSLATLLMPLAVNHGLTYVLICRFFQGIGASILYPAIGCISNNWSAISQIGTYVAFLSSSFQFSNIVTMPISGVLCESSLTWRSIYYLFGAVSLISFIIFYSFYTNNPADHYYLSNDELQFINEGKNSFNKSPKKRSFTLSVFGNREVFLMTIAIVGACSAIITMNNYGPIYLNKVLGLDIKDTGYSNTIPYLFAVVVKFTAGSATDKLHFIPERVRLFLFALSPQAFVAFGFLIMSFTSTVIIAQLAYTFSVILSALNIVGMVKSAQIVAPDLIDTVMVVLSMSSWLSAFLLPLAIGLACPDNSPHQWASFYFAVALIVLLTNLPFPIFARLSSHSFSLPFRKQSGLKSTQ